MKYGKIMSSSNLEIIANRMHGCELLLRSLAESAETSVTQPLVVESVADLFAVVLRDFQADIDGAEDYVKEDTI